MNSYKYLNILKSIHRKNSSLLSSNIHSHRCYHISTSSLNYSNRFLNNKLNIYQIISKRDYCSVSTAATPSSTENKNIDNTATVTTATTETTKTTTETTQQSVKSEDKPTCWCLINCKLKSKRIHVSKVKPIPYENDKGYVLGEYNINYESPLSESRKLVLDAMISEKKEAIEESEKQRKQEEKEIENEKKQTKQLFKTEEEREEEERVYPVLNDTTTSIGPVHALYKNEWIITVVERTETDNKDNEPYFVLKLKTPIRQTNDVSFNIESLSYFSSIEKLLSFMKSVECNDKEFEKLFLTKSDSKWTKAETKWLVEKRPYLREALMSLKLHLLPSVGFENCGINLELKKEDRVKCKEDSSLEFPDGVYQLCLEIDSTESIWKKSPEAIEKILYLYTVMFDSIVSLGYTDDAPIDQVYL